MIAGAASSEKKFQTIYLNASIFGFSLIELLTVLVIIGILSAISLPIYSHYLVNAHRAEATATLSKLAVALEQYYVVHNSYENASLENLGFPEKIADNRYQLMITSETSDGYELKAIPLGSQMEDSDCSTLSLNSTGEKTISGKGDWRRCW